MALKAALGFPSSGGSEAFPPPPPYRFPPSFLRELSMLDRNGVASSLSHSAAATAPAPPLRRGPAFASCASFSLGGDWPLAYELPPTPPLLQASPLEPAVETAQPCLHWPLRRFWFTHPHCEVEGNALMYLCPPPCPRAGGCLHTQRHTSRDKTFPPHICSGSQAALLLRGKERCLHRLAGLSPSPLHPAPLSG